MPGGFLLPSEEWYDLLCPLPFCPEVPFVSQKTKGRHMKRLTAAQHSAAQP